MKHDGKQMMFLARDIGVMILFMLLLLTPLFGYNYKILPRNSTEMGHEAPIFMACEGGFLTLRGIWDLTHDPPNNLGDIFWRDLFCELTGLLAGSTAQLILAKHYDTPESQMWASLGRGHHLIFRTGITIPFGLIELHKNRKVVATAMRALKHTTGFV
jgi:hypothetical protein